MVPCIVIYMLPVSKEQHLKYVIAILVTVYVA